MQVRRTYKLFAGLGLGVIIAIAAGCSEEYRPSILGGTWGETTVAGSVFTGPSGQAFTEILLQDRTFVEGRVVTTTTYDVDDLTRSPLLIDFNGDGKVDPVVGYEQQQFGVIQIMLSYGDLGEAEYTSLTLDGGENQWLDLRDVEVADIDGDGSLDIVAATAEGVVYLHHPSDPDRTHVLSEWGQPTGALEIVEGTGEAMTNDELDALLEQELGPGADVNNYVVTVDTGAHECRNRRLQQRRLQRHCGVAAIAR